MQQLWLLVVVAVVVGVARAQQETATGVATSAPLSTTDIVCPENETLCSQACVNLQNDTQNCGECGYLCGLLACVAGECGCEDTGEDICEQGTRCCEHCCDDFCRNVTDDDDHCGGCGIACNQTQDCVDSICVSILTTTQPLPSTSGIVCAENETYCSQECVSLQNDTQNCGECGVRCAALAPCENGTCGCSFGKPRCTGVCCGHTQECCHGVCLESDDLHCGDECVQCSSVESCVNGSCVCGETREPCGQFCCDNASELCCNETCVLFNNDTLNCGACAVECELSCVNGTCDDGPDISCFRVFTCYDVIGTQLAPAHCGLVSHLPCSKRMTMLQLILSAVVSPITLAAALSCCCCCGCYLFAYDESTRRREEKEH